MSLTNFARLTSNQKTAWSKDMWRQARNLSFLNKFVGESENSLIQRVTELKKSEKGTRAVITLVADLEGDGIAGDRTLEGNEEAMKAFDQVIRIDQLRHANRAEGRIADQRSVVRFRENSRNVLSYWISDRLDQLAFLTLSGMNYSLKNNGAPRIGSDLQNLEFSADVSGPTSARTVRWNNQTNQQVIVTGAGSSAIQALDTPTWQMLVQLKAYAKEQYIRGIRDGNGEETYHVFMTPTAMARLKMDNNYMLNVRHAVERGKGNDLFTGTSVKVDGLYIHEFRHVPHTSGAASGSKWGAGGLVDGSVVLFCGAQALGFADIGDAEWDEKEFDYNNQPAISTGKIFGFLKPKFYSQYSGGTVQDFGVITCYCSDN